MTAVLTRHARDRVVEFGLGLDVVTEIATRPDVTHTNSKGETVAVCDRHPEWTVVLGDDGIVITVLRRTTARWEHGSPSIPSTPPPPSGVEGAPVVDVPIPRRPPSGRRRRPTPALPARGGVVATTRVDPEALRLARQLADGDVRRLRFNLDGSVTILNRAPGGRG